MDRRTVLIRYDEIGLKGKNRKFFEKCLLRNIKRVLSCADDIIYTSPRGRIFLDIPFNFADECTLRLKTVPGIASFSVGVTMGTDFDAIAELGVKMIAPRLESSGALKFCVRTRRSIKTFPQTSPEINFEVGSRIMAQLSSKGLVVNIRDAEYVLEVEIGRSGAVVFDTREPGLRGLPVGSSGSVLCLLSGGIDSPVAAFMMACRGCRVHSVFFDNQPFLGRGGYEKVVSLAKKINKFQAKGILFVVPFQDIQTAIRDQCSDENRIVLYRRMMYRIAESIANRYKLLALITGEAVGQVASQTLENLAAVSRVTTLSVFRPLIGMNKESIITRAKEIGTYETSIEPQPDCCSVFMPDNPATRSKIPWLERDEEKFPWQELSQDALAKMEIIKVDDL
ncbi:MAG: tRNA 4-thiouridine(8) synthase ThiI [Nitrospinaceae bacterium]|nr:tRNA 4-thiouridine(8) synthase ThiI [Nitrospina sp.]MBT5867594.1 tRNA 4-thiouridine(8) synthase ThiI [Nitrospinaceae bacterium]